MTIVLVLKKRRMSVYENTFYFSLKSFSHVKIVTKYAYNFVIGSVSYCFQPRIIFAAVGFII